MCFWNFALGVFPIYAMIKTKYYSYAEYAALVSDCAANGSTTGLENSAKQIEATKLNAHRMLRISKTFVPEKKLSDLIRSVNKKLEWVVISEAWCGDSAQNLPIIAALAQLNSNITLRIMLRDENNEFMLAHTTSGSRSIPKLICYDTLTHIELGEWGPRPKEIGARVQSFKKENPNINHDDFVKELHLWYARDKGLSIQSDLFALIGQWVSA